jgi:hypothetical protein
LFNESPYEISFNKGFGLLPVDFCDLHVEVVELELETEGVLLEELVAVELGAKDDGWLSELTFSALQLVDERFVARVSDVFIIQIMIERETTLL